MDNIRTFFQIHTGTKLDVGRDGGCHDGGHCRAGAGDHVFDRLVEGPCRQEERGLLFYMPLPLRGCIVGSDTAPGTSYRYSCSMGWPRQALSRPSFTRRRGSAVN